MEDWAEIRRLHRAEGMPIKAIARMLGCSKNTVKSALGSDELPQYRRSPRGFVVDTVEPRIGELLAAWPDMPATVIAFEMRTFPLAPACPRTPRAGASRGCRRR